METELHLEALTKHVAGSLAVPVSSAAAEAKGTDGFCFKHYSYIGGAGKDPTGTAGDDQTALTQAFV